MSHRDIPRSDEIANKKFEKALEKLLPERIQKLSEDVKNRVTTAVYASIQSPSAKVPLEVILRKKYEWLVKEGHLEAFTQAEIDAAQDPEIEKNVSPEPGTGPDGAGMIV